MLYINIYIRLNPLKKISTENKIEREYLLTVENTRVLTCRFNQEDNLLAIGGEDGITRIMTPNKSEQYISILYIIFIKKVC